MAFLTIVTKFDVLIITLYPHKNKINLSLRQMLVDNCSIGINIWATYSIALHGIEINLDLRTIDKSPSVG